MPSRHWRIAAAVRVPRRDCDRAANGGRRPSASAEPGTPPLGRRRFGRALSAVAGAAMRALKSTESLDRFKFQTPSGSAIADSAFADPPPPPDRAALGPPPPPQFALCGRAAADAYAGGVDVLGEGADAAVALVARALSAGLVTPTPAHIPTRSFRDPTPWSDRDLTRCSDRDWRP